MTSGTAVGQENAASPRPVRARYRDDEELQWYVGHGHDLLSRSVLGAQLECLRDDVSGQPGWKDWDPTWLLDFSKGSAIAKARRAAITLWGAAEVHRDAPAALWDFCHPVTVSACDGLKGAAGRLLVLYPHTATGSGFARRMVVKGGMRSRDALRRMHDDERRARGEERAVWAKMLEEARELRDMAFAAYATSGAFVARFYRDCGLMPNRRELAEGLGR